MGTDQPRKRPSEAWPPAAPGPRAISALEVYPIAELLQRLNWGRKTLRAARLRGLKVVAFGRERFVLGRDVIRFFAGLEAAQGRPPRRHDNGNGETDGPSPQT